MHFLERGLTGGLEAEFGRMVAFDRKHEKAEKEVQPKSALHHKEKNITAHVLKLNINGKDYKGIWSFYIHDHDGWSAIPADGVIAKRYKRFAFKPRKLVMHDGQNLVRRVDMAFILNVRMINSSNQTSPIKTKFVLIPNCSTFCGYDFSLGSNLFRQIPWTMKLGEDDGRHVRILMKRHKLINEDNLSFALSNNKLLEGLEISPSMFSIVKHFDDIFKPLDRHGIHLKDDSDPYLGGTLSMNLSICRLRRISKTDQSSICEDRCDRETEELLDMGIVEQSDSRSHLDLEFDENDKIIGLKADRLNDITEDLDPGLTMKAPSISQISNFLKSKNIFTKLKLKQAWFQINLDKADRELTSYRLHTGNYHFTKCPFGLKFMWPRLQKILSTIFKPASDYVIIHRDVIFVCGKTQREHDDNLRDVETICSKYNIKLDLKGCEFGKPELEFDDFIVGPKLKPARQPIMRLMNRLKRGKIHTLKDDLKKFDIFLRDPDSKKNLKLLDNDDNPFPAAHVLLNRLYLAVHGLSDTHCKYLSD